MFGNIRLGMRDAAVQSDYHLDVVVGSQTRTFADASAQVDEDQTMLETLKLKEAEKARRTPLVRQKAEQISMFPESSARTSGVKMKRSTGIGDDDSYLVYLTY